MLSTKVQDPQVLVLVEAENPGQANYRRGHLFEEFMARVMELYGYSQPTTTNLNVAADGVEIDIELEGALTGELAMAECVVNIRISVRLSLTPRCQDVAVARVEASVLVQALERVWSAIQRRHPDVPHVVVTLGAGSIGVPRGALKLGHFAADRWIGSGEASSAVAELFVGGEGLVQGAESVLPTLLHEAAHGIAHVRQIQDTSRQGRYHNNRYKSLGEEVGLAITQVADIGWSGTALADRTAAAYAVELVQLAGAITAYRYAEGSVPGSGGGAAPAGGRGGGGSSKGGGAARPKNGLVLTCDCRRRIRISETVAALGPILCGLCSSEFTHAGHAPSRTWQTAANLAGLRSLATTKGGQPTHVNELVDELEDLLLDVVA